MSRVGSLSGGAKRIAAPMVGGMLRSSVLTPVVIPAVYSLWKEWEMEKVR